MKLSKLNAGVGWVWRRTGWKAVYGLCVAFFLLTVGSFYQPGTGFTCLISIGSFVDQAAVPAFKAAPHYVYEDSYGYDGTYYAQLALHPGLQEPALDQAIDNPHYRARRILVPWLAWFFGGGEPRWILQVYALANVVCWLLLAWLLLSWFPPGSLDHFLRWAGILFSAGMCLSVRHSLLDGPGLLLVAAAVRLREKQQLNGAAWTMAAAVLSKETSVLATTMFAGPQEVKGWRGWAKLGLIGAVVVAPMIGWMYYVSRRFGRVEDTGEGNFTLPLAGFAEKWGTVIAEIGQYGWQSLHLLSLVGIFAILVQFLFMVARWRPREVWWRVGAAFAVLLLFLSEPVWEGYPGAAARVLLPMALAFNLLVPKGRRWLAVLLAGNLSFLVGLTELRAPPGEFFQVNGQIPLTIERGTGWYPVESDGRRSWRWARSDATVVVTNPTAEAIEVRLEGALRSVSPGRLSLLHEGVELWSSSMELERVGFATPPFSLASGAVATVEFRTDRPAIVPQNGDPRSLTFALYDLEVTATRLPIVAPSAR